MLLLALVVCYLQGMFKEVMDKYKIRTKVAMLVTDNAANMLKARKLVVENPAYGHILETRCVRSSIAVDDFY